MTSPSAFLYRCTPGSAGIVRIFAGKSMGARNVLILLDGRCVRCVTKMADEPHFRESRVRETRVRPPGSLCQEVIPGREPGFERGYVCWSEVCVGTSDYSGAVGSIPAASDNQVAGGKEGRGGACRRACEGAPLRPRPDHRARKCRLRTCHPGQGPGGTRAAWRQLHQLPRDVSSLLPELFGDGCRHRLRHPPPRELSRRQAAELSQRRGAQDDRRPTDRLRARFQTICGGNAGRDVPLEYLYRACV